MRKKRTAIDKLPPNIKETVDDMIKSNSTYGEIVDYIKSSGNNISLSAIQRYAVNLVRSLQALQIANQNFKAINDEIENYKNTDCMEAILILLNSKLLERINSLPDEQLQNLDTTQLVKSTVALTKAMAYKKKTIYRQKVYLKMVQSFLNQPSIRQWLKKLRSYTESSRNSLMTTYPYYNLLRSPSEFDYSGGFLIPYCQKSRIFTGKTDN